MVAANPYSVSFAGPMISSSSSNGITEPTGPKISSRIRRIVGRVFAMIVGAIK
jgi:hypothetical protein